MAGLLEHYHRAKGAGLMELGSDSPKDMSEAMENVGIIAATGAGLAGLSSILGGLDHPILGIKVPVDGLVSLGLMYAGMEAKSKTLTIAGIAAGGSAAVRTLEAFFKAGMHSMGVKGEFEDLQGGYGGLGWGGAPQYGQRQLGAGYGFGQAHQERLVEAAKYL